MRFPIVDVRHPQAKVTHEAAIGSVDSSQLQTLMARGLDEKKAAETIIQGMLNGWFFIACREVKNLGFSHNREDQIIKPDFSVASRISREAGVSRYNELELSCI